MCTHVHAWIRSAYVGDADEGMSNASDCERATVSNELTKYEEILQNTGKFANYR